MAEDHVKASAVQMKGEKTKKIFREQIKKSAEEEDTEKDDRLNLNILPKGFDFEGSEYIMEARQS